MLNIAILGLGVVGGGVADLITNNKKEVLALGGEEINIKYILDIRDFPSSPYKDKIVHDYSLILSDPELECGIEVMGGSHPAYEYTLAALKAKKSVITSNKEVVAKYGDEFLRIAREMGVCYRFEAAVGGGIPVISPLLCCVGQNKITEVRGILNGTTNYILTKMFSFGEGFEESLKDAQERGYAERNPDADILGIDAARKIAILTAIMTGKLLPPEKIHTEGITKIRKEDVACAAKIGRVIKLVGRCIISGEHLSIMVAPFMLSSDTPLSNVSGVYNAVELLGEPIGSVMFYGPGAGAGPTASAVVGDLMQIMRSGTATATPVVTKSEEGALDFADFTAQRYLAISGVGGEIIEGIFGGVQIIGDESEIAFITKKISERELNAALLEVEKAGGATASHIRIM